MRRYGWHYTTCSLFIIHYCIVLVIVIKKQKRGNMIKRVDKSASEKNVK